MQIRTVPVSVERRAVCLFSRGVSDEVVDSLGGAGLVSLMSAHGLKGGAFDGVVGELYDCTLLN